MRQQLRTTARLMAKPMELRTSDKVATSSPTSKPTMFEYSRVSTSWGPSSATTAASVLHQMIRLSCFMSCANEEEPNVDSRRYTAGFTPRIVFLVATGGDVAD